jgi:predicted small lipoprotein YifL
MRTELATGRLALICVTLLSLGGCGQTGALVLPGAVPADESQAEESSATEDQEEDESGR